MKKKIFLGLLLLLVAFNVFAKPITSTSPIASGYYVDRFTDNAYYFTSTAISYVKWPSGAVIWTISSAPCFFNNSNNFEVYIRRDSPARPYFTSYNRSLYIMFVNGTQNGRAGVTLKICYSVLDPLGGYPTLYQTQKFYVKQ